jgi:hypothetical protein
MKTILVWQALIDELIANLAAETPGEELRINIGHKIREAETKASNLAAPATLAEKSAHRKQEFHAALRLTLGALRGNFRKLGRHIYLS